MLIPQWYSIEILGWVLSFQVIIADSTSTVTLGQQASLTTTITAIPPTSLTSRLVNVPAARGGYFTDIQAVQPIYKVHNPSLPNQLIGGIFPLYDDLGMPILSGHQLLLAYQCQIDLINGNTSILPDTQLVPIIQNIGSSSDLQNSRAAYILSQRNTLVSIGPLTQSQNFIFDGILGSKNLTFISYGGVKIDSTDLLPQTADFFTLLPSTSVYVKAIIDTIKRFNWKLISTVFYYHDSITSVDFDILKIALNKSDILTTCDAIIIPSNVDTEISRFVSCLEKTTVTVVILWMNQVIANQVIESLYAVSKFSQITFLAFSDLTYLFCSPEVNPNVAFQGTGLTPGNVTSSYPVSYLEGKLFYLKLIFFSLLDRQIKKQITCAIISSTSSIRLYQIGKVSSIIIFLEITKNLIMNMKFIFKLIKKNLRIEILSNYHRLESYFIPIFEHI